MAAIDPNKTVVTSHASGIARLTFSPDGLFLYTSGAEGYMRVFDARTEEENPFDVRLMEYHEEPITSISATNEYLCSACESGAVVLHQTTKDGLGGMEFERIVTRSSLPARMARFNPKGTKIAVASDELIVKVISARDPEDIQHLMGHKKAVRDVVWSPDGQLLVTSDADGQVRIWEFAQSEPNCVQVLDGLVPSDEPESDYPVSIVWHPSSKYFVVASRTNDIVVISRESWAKGGVFSGRDGEGHSSKISSLAFSSNGLYLASAGTEGKVIVWNAETRHPVNQTMHSASALITAMAFHPAKGSNTLAWIDYTGNLTQWTTAIPLGKGLPLPGGPPPNAAKEHDDFDAALDDNWIDDDAGVFGGGPISQDSRRGEVNNTLFRDEEADEASDDDDLRNPFEEKQMTRPAIAATRKVSEWRRNDAPTSSFLSSSTKPQEAFQPGATPFKDSKRYLAFNMLGLIHVVEREEHNIVTLEFHDRSANPGLHFNDHFKYTLGALGELGSVFACKSSGDQPSLIYYRPYESWTNVQDWQYKLPPSENATVLAVGGIADELDEELSISGTGTVVVATDRGFVRFFTGSGLQKYVWNLGEEVVSAVAGKDWAMVVWRAGAAADKRQNLEYTILDTDTFEVVQQGRMPLGKNATLKWIGFTEDHIPAMYDSDGLLSILDRARRPRQARWVPVLDMHGLARREGKQESYWPIGVTQKHVHAIILKGAERFPHFPTPIFQDIDLQLPLLRQDNQQGQLEEQYLRETMFVSHRRDGASPSDYTLKTQLAREELETDKHLLMSIRTACKAEKLQAALDATLMLSQPVSIDAALKIANFFSLPALEERIELVREAKTGIRAENEGNKRKEKWSHLVDDRTILSTSNGRRSGGDNNIFGAPPSSYASVRPSASYAQPLVSRVLTVSKSSRMEKVDSGHGFSDPSELEHEGESFDFMEQDEEPQTKRQRSSSSPEGDEAFAAGDDQESHLFTEEPEEVAPAAPKKAVNPFSKRATVAKPPPSKAGPFASQRGSGTAKDLSRTGSFFNRVEGKEPPKAKGSKGAHVLDSNGASSKPKPKGTQTTLFGLPPVDPASIDKKSTKGKKRKSMGDIDEEDGDAGEKRGNAALKGFGSRDVETIKELPREGEDFEETQAAETQEESQTAIPLKIFSKKGDKAPTDEEVRQDAEEMDVEETQIEDTQLATQIEEEAIPQTGLSKLERFRMAAPATAEA